MYRFSPGAVFPRHRHPQEQITLIQEGEVDFSVGDEVRHLSAGGWLVVRSDVEHQIHAAGGGAEVVALVIPPRDDGDPYTVVEDGGGA
jgi:quercetin dioxygenase-like cupin family protein